MTPETGFRKPHTLWQRLSYPFLRGRQAATPPPVAFFTDTSLCIGCKACQVACKQWNMLPGDAPHLSGHSYDNTLRLSAHDWRHVKFIEQIKEDATPNNRHNLFWLMASDSCKHCADAACLRACPTGALMHTEYGTVYAQSDICNGCASCVAACPFGVITRNEASGHSHKCAFCLDRLRDNLVPACAHTCPSGSIRFGTLEAMRSLATERLAVLHGQGVQEARLYGHEDFAAYSPLHNFFLLLDEPARYGLPDAPFHPRHHLVGDYARAAAGLLAGLALVALPLLI